MKWSWKIGSYAGIGVYIHATFLLLLAYIVLSSLAVGQGVGGTTTEVIFTLLIFLCVLLHEFGHALTAKRFGIRTRDITLLPIGGVARLERMPDRPIQELWVAIAGPAVNVGIAFALFVIIVFGKGSIPELSTGDGSLLDRLFTVNLLLVGFNMIPAFPMDGGRVLRALLATRLEYTRATSIAAFCGQGIAFLFGLAGFFTNPFLIFIALFVWIGAQQEASMAQMKSSLSGIPVSRAMLTDFRVLHPQDTLARAVEYTIAGFQTDFPVLEGGSVAGILLRSDLIPALGQRGQSATVESVMQRNVPTVDASDMLETAVPFLQSGRCHTLPVMRAGALVGLLTMDNVGEFVMIESAIRQTVSKSIRMKWLRTQS